MHILFLTDNFPVVIEDTFCFLDFGQKHRTKQLVIDFVKVPFTCLMTIIILPIPG